MISFVNIIFSKCLNSFTKNFYIPIPLLVQKNSTKSNSDSRINNNIKQNSLFSTQVVYITIIEHANYRQKITT